MPIKQKLTKLTNSITRYGIIGTWQKFYERKFAPWNTDEPDWQKYLPTEEERKLYISYPDKDGAQDYDFVLRCLSGK